MSRSWVLLGLCLGAFAWAQGPETVTVPSPEEGERLYAVHCSGCHGEAAEGNGPMSLQLEPPPPNLTLLGQRHGGEMDTEKVYQIIDGRQDLPGHGQRQMPVWGFSFQTLGMDSDQEREVRWRIESLVLYLETIQHPPTAKGGP